MARPAASTGADLALIAVFAALIAVLGLIPKITLAFGVPITAQSLGVMLCGTVLGARRGALAVGLFLLLVALGLPLLAGGRGGLGVFASPTVGFLVGFPVAAFVTGWITERWRSAPVGIAAGVAAVPAAPVITTGPVPAPRAGRRAGPGPGARVGGVRPQGAAGPG